MQKTGPHYCCDWTGVTATMFSPRTIRGLYKHFGMDFPMFSRRRSGRQSNFPQSTWNEDGEFSLHAQSKFKVDGFHDTTGLCLHFLHPGSTSRCFPQHHLPKFLFQRLFPALEYPVARSDGVESTERNGNPRSSAGLSFIGISIQLGPRTTSGWYRTHGRGVAATLGRSA